jgi:hypothetical protein
MTTPRKPTRSVAMRKAFEKQFGLATDSASSYPNRHVHLLSAFKAGTAWQRRQRRRP